jgi:hypothetical protein
MWIAKDFDGTLKTFTHEPTPEVEDGKTAWSGFGFLASSIGILDSDWSEMPCGTLLKLNWITHSKAFWGKAEPPQQAKPLAKKKQKQSAKTKPEQAVKPKPKQEASKVDKCDNCEAPRADGFRLCAGCKEEAMKAARKQFWVPHYRKRSRDEMENTYETKYGINW